MRVNYGFSKVGTKAIVRVPKMKGRNVSVMAAISKNNIVHYKILDENGNQHVFQDFLAELRQKIPNNLLQNTFIIMDNVRFHHTKAVIDYMDYLELQYKYLPAYSPHFNPIEKFFNQWKHSVKRLAPTTEQDLLAKINQVDLFVEPDNFKNYYSNISGNCVKCLNNQLDAYE